MLQQGAAADETDAENAAKRYFFCFVLNKSVGCGIIYKNKYRGARKAG